MGHSTLLRFAAMLTLCLAAPFVLGANASPDELAKQAEFKKAYNNPDKGERIKALTLLEGFIHPSTLQLYSTVLTGEPESDVKLEAYTALAKVPARDTSVTRILAQHFSQLKPNETKLRLQYAKALEGVQFKYEVVNVMVDAASRMLYPEMPSAAAMRAMGTGTVNNTVKIEKAREDFESLLEAINKIAKTTVGKEKGAPTELKKWWAANQAKFLQEDKVLVDKYRAEDAPKK